MQSVKRWMQRNGIGKGVIIFTLSVFVLVFAAFGSSIVNFVFGQYTTNDEVVTIYIGDKATIESIAGLLEVNEIMTSSKFIFWAKIYTDWNTRIKKVFEGEYTIPPKIHVKDLLRILKLKDFEYKESVSLTGSFFLAITTNNF